MGGLIRDSFANLTNFTLNANIQSPNNPYFTFQDGDGANYFVWYSVTGFGGQPSGPGTAIHVNYTEDMSAASIATETYAAITATPYSFSATLSSNVLTVTNKHRGPGTATIGTLAKGVTIVIIKQGK